MNQWIFMGFLILVLILFFFNQLLQKKFREIENFSNYFDLTQDSLQYYRCHEKELGSILGKVFDKNGIEKNNENWDIYVPCGYNHVEDELLEIKILDKIKNKYIFGINGCDSIVAKNYIWSSLVECYGRKGAKELMPETFILYDLNDMESFRQSYHENDIYIMKKNVQRKEGLKLTQDYSEIMNGIQDDYKIVQKYVRDLYLINQRKVNLRIYLLIVLKDGKKSFYLSTHGKCIYTNKDYNDKELDFESNITSFHLDLSIYKKNPRTFQQLIHYIDQDMGSGKGLLLFQRIQESLKKVCQCIEKNLYQSKNLEHLTSFQLFGIDVIFTKDLKPYLLEMNKGPDMNAKDEHDEKMKYRVQDDMLQTVGILPNFPFQNSFQLIYEKK